MVGGVGSASSVHASPQETPTHPPQPGARDQKQPADQQTSPDINRHQQTSTDIRQQTTDNRLPPTHRNQQRLETKNSQRTNRHHSKHPLTKFVLRKLNQPKSLFHQDELAGNFERHCLDIHRNTQKFHSLGFLETSNDFQRISMDF